MFIIRDQKGFKIEWTQVYFTLVIYKKNRDNFKLNMNTIMFSYVNFLVGVQI